MIGIKEYISARFAAFSFLKAVRSYLEDVSFVSKRAKPILKRQ